MLTFPLVLIKRLSAAAFVYPISTRIDNESRSTRLDEAEAGMEGSLFAG
jgi:hypothetical protein